MDRPIDNSYWVLPGRFLAGEYPGHTDEAVARTRMDRFLATGVRLFVDLTGPADRLAPYDQWCGPAQHIRSQIPDVSVPNDPHQMTTILTLIDEALAKSDGVVYVHCWGGIGRTGVVVGCWLARHGHLGKAALDRLDALWQACPKSTRRPSPETTEQMSYVLQWSEGAG